MFLAARVANLDDKEMQIRIEEVSDSVAGLSKRDDEEDEESEDEDETEDSEE